MKNELIVIHKYQPKMKKHLKKSIIFIAAFIKAEKREDISTNIFVHYLKECRNLFDGNWIVVSSFLFLQLSAIFVFLHIVSVNEKSIKYSSY